MRLFIAAELPEDVLEALAETSALLRSCMHGRFVAPDSFHVTLAFLGETDGARVAELAELLDDACAGCGPIPVSLGALGSFGKARRATLWQAVESDGVLETLAESVRKGLARQGFSFDEKGFLAHMTLMRSADISRGELPMPQVAWGSVEEVSLFKSDLSGKHPVYTPLHTVRLA